MQACPWAGAHSSQKYCTAEIQNYKTLSMLNTGNEGTFFFSVVRLYKVHTKVFLSLVMKALPLT